MCLVTEPIQLNDMSHRLKPTDLTEMSQYAAPVISGVSKFSERPLLKHVSDKYILLTYAAGATVASAVSYISSLYNTSRKLEVGTQ